MGAASAVVLGALLLAGIVDPKIGSSLVPAGGGTFNGSTQHSDGLRPEPVDRWSHLALTYDGATLRLYMDGSQVSSMAPIGRILRTTDPLWIGGNRPYGEYFRGRIDEIRVYDRALGQPALRVAMSTPIASGGRSHAAGLVAAYAFDAGRGGTADDASGNGNTATIHGAKWTTRGRFGDAMSFDGPGEVVRVPASASLNLRSAMTLSAWIRPSETQPGWRTILARQTDAYFLMAGGGRERAGQLHALDDVRFALLIVLAVGICVVLATGRASWAAGRRLWYWPLVGLFVAGSVADAALAPSDTLIGPALGALWCGATASRRDVTTSMYILAAAFGGVTMLAATDPGALPLAHDDGAVARSAAVGLLFVVAGLLSARHSSRGGEQRGP